MNELELDQYLQQYQHILIPDAITSDIFLLTSTRWGALPREYIKCPNDYIANRLNKVFHTLSPWKFPYPIWLPLQEEHFTSKQEYRILDAEPALQYLADGQCICYFTAEIIGQRTGGATDKHIIIIGGEAQSRNVAELWHTILWEAAQYQVIITGTAVPQPSKIHPSLNERQESIYILAIEITLISGITVWERIDKSPNFQTTPSI